MTWRDSAKIVQKLLYDMFEDEDGPSLAEQTRFFRDISRDCDGYATEINALLDDTAGS